MSECWTRTENKTYGEFEVCSGTQRKSKEDKKKVAKMAERAKLRAGLRKTE